MDVAVYNSEKSEKPFKFRTEEGLSLLQDDLNLLSKKAKTLESLYGYLAVGVCATWIALVYFVVVNFAEYNSDVVPATIAAASSMEFWKYLPQVYCLSLFHNFYFFMERSQILNNLDCIRLAVTSISSLTSILILTSSTPIVVDHITGCEVLLLRWVEWICLGFVMTALSCLSKPEQFRHSMIMAFVNASSTAFGFLFPFITDPTLWSLAFGISTLLFMVIYFELYEKKRDFKEIKLRSKTYMGRNHMHLRNEMEMAQHSYHIAKWMACIWSAFVFMYLFEVYLRHSIHEPKTTRKWFIILECCVDTLAKQIYSRYLAAIMSTLHDPIRMTSSRLRSLQEQIEIIWDNAQDALIILREKEGEQVVSHNSTFIDLFGENVEGSESLLNFLRNVVNGKYHVAGKLIRHDFTPLNGGTINTEISLKRMESEKAIVMIVRDVSSRIREQALEREYLAEKIAREKDLESSSFMRHETKNHLLNLRVLLHQISEMVVERRNIDPKDSKLDQSNDIERTSHVLTKLKLENDRALLSVMRYSLMKEIAYGEYECSLKPTTMRNILEPYLGSQKNAVSNALKYGNKREKVTIKGVYHPTNKKIEFVVSNIPGDNARAMKMLPDKSVIFRRKSNMNYENIDVLEEEDHEHGTRKDENIENYTGFGGNFEHKMSTGDGGWIMKTCTNLLKGTCSYQFKETVTEFILSIPVQPTSSVRTEKDRSSTNAILTNLSNNILVIGLDDSSIQRLMVKRLFSTMQIHCVVTGETAEEAIKFPSFVKNISTENPDKKLVILIDENLDYTESDQHVTISGSRTIPEVKKVCTEYHPDVLILMRSANDSKREMAVFRERGAHGSFEKLIRTSDAVVQALEKYGLGN